MKSTQPVRALEASYGMLGQSAADLVWAMEWLDTLTDRLGEDHMVREFLDDLKERRKESYLINMAAGVTKI